MNKEQLLERDFLKLRRGDLIVDFHFFRQKPLNRVWLENEAIKLYVRKSIRLIEGQQLDFIDIASIIVNENYQNKGFFQSVLKELLEFKTLNFYAENVCTDRSRHIFTKFNFVEVNLDHLQRLPILKICDMYHLSEKEI